MCTNHCVPLSKFSWTTVREDWLLLLGDEVLVQFGAEMGIRETGLTISLGNVLIRYLYSTILT